MSRWKLVTLLRMSQRASSSLSFRWSLPSIDKSSHAVYPATKIPEPQYMCTWFLWVREVGYTRCFGLQNICERSLLCAAPHLAPLAEPISNLPMSCSQAAPVPRSEFLGSSHGFCGRSFAQILPLPRNSTRSNSRGMRISCSQPQFNVVGTTVGVADRIKQGFEKFKNETYLQKPKLFSELAEGQSPKFMVIACSDSRVCPTTILGFQPGEAFVVRNVANMVPPPEQAGYPGTSAALEYAVTALKVENILVIGHSRCGGIKALMTQKENAKKWSAFIEDWIAIGGPARAATLQAGSQQEIDHQCTKCEKESVNVSLSNLLAFPFVKEAVASGQLALHGGYYNFVEGSFEYWTFGADGKPSEVSKF